MNYEVRFPTQSLEDKFYKALTKITPRSLQEKIMEETANLGSNPYPYGKKVFKKLTPPVRLQQYTAGYRLRFRDYRVLYDVDEKRKIVWVFVLRLRSEKTYKG
jgi:mRNA-degrading endonuclease RelE of RelBE toxin-antitoxin system